MTSNIPRFLGRTFVRAIGSRLSRKTMLIASFATAFGGAPQLARAQDPHHPLWQQKLEECATRLNQGGIKFDAVVPIGSGRALITAPGHAVRDTTDDCNNLSWVSTAPGVYGTLALGAYWGGPDINRFPTIPNQNGWDCGHSAVIYGVFTRPSSTTGPGGYSLQSYGVGWGSFDAASNTCRHDWQAGTIPASEGTQTAGVTNANHVVIAAMSWQHNDSDLGHIGTYCADNADADSACLWDTNLVFVRQSPTFPSGNSHIGVFNGGNWALDKDGDGTWTGADVFVSNFGQPGDTPIIRHAGGLTTAKSMISVYNAGNWWLDTNRDYAWDAGDEFAAFGSPGDQPVAGLWTTGWTAFLHTDNIGVFNSGNWALDGNNNQIWEGQGRDFYFQNFGQASDRPVAGRWSGNGLSGVGAFNGGNWWLDYNENRSWDDGDRFFSFGIPGDLPVVGDWNGSGTDKIGVFRNGWWFLDWNGNGVWDSGDVVYAFGSPGDQPVAGTW